MAHEPDRPEPTQAMRHAVTTLTEEARRMETAVRSLTEEVRTVADAVDLIATIAAQTDRLTRNATIEAEQAGDDGLRLALVAPEVKRLATQTAAATDQIGARMREIQAALNDATADLSRRVAQLTAEAGGLVDEGKPT